MLQRKCKTERNQQWLRFYSVINKDKLSLKCFMLMAIFNCSGFKQIVELTAITKAEATKLNL
jgi:hypothetical protein